MNIEEFIAKDPCAMSMGTFRVYDGDVKVGILSENAAFDKMELSEHERLMSSKQLSESYYSIIDIRNLFYVSSESKTWVKQSTHVGIVKSMALIVHSLINIQIAEALLNLPEIETPKKYFQDFDTALQWTIDIKKAG